MGDPPKSPYAWRMPPLPSLQLPPPPSPLPKYNTLPMLYYGLLVVGTAAVVLAMYNLIVVRWCTDHWTSATSPPTRPRLVEVTGGDSQSFERPGLNMLSSFKYFKKDAVAENGELECAVCLSVVEDGEEIRQLPRCKHEFHLPCIDMWLYSHSNCPLCRAPAAPPISHGLQEPSEWLCSILDLPATLGLCSNVMRWPVISLKGPA